MLDETVPDHFLKACNEPVTYTWQCCFWYAGSSCDIWWMQCKYDVM